MRKKGWNEIFFASCNRGDDPCYAMFLADEYIKRKSARKDAERCNVCNAAKSSCKGH